jgi:hypothetical protein
MGSRRFVVDAATATALFVASSSVHTIRSSAAVSGWFEADIEDGRFKGGSSLSGHLEIPIKGLSSGNPIIDREMRRRAGSGRHLQIVGDIESTLEIEATSATITGTIGFFGESELVEGEIRLLSGPRIAGTGEFDVRWWGFEPPKVLMLRVDPIITVEIDLPLTYRT